MRRTAAFEFIDHDGGGQTLIDPATGAPAVQRTDGALVAPPGAPDGLEELTQRAWPNGTVLTREQLEAARAGYPPHPPLTR